MPADEQISKSNRRRRHRLAASVHQDIRIILCDGASISAHRRHLLNKIQYAKMGTGRGGTGPKSKSKKKFYKKHTLSEFRRDDSLACTPRRIPTPGVFVVLALQT